MRSNGLSESDACLLRYALLLIAVFEPKKQEATSVGQGSVVGGKRNYYVSLAGRLFR